MVASGRHRSAPTTSPGRTRARKEPEEGEVLDDGWTDELPPGDPELEDQFGSLEAAEAFAMTEFKNASSDMRHATRTFMEAKVTHARGYFPVVGVGAFDGFQTITPRGSRQTGAGKSTSTGMNSQAGKGRGRGLGKGKPPRASRRPSPAKSRVTSTGAAKGGPAHGTRIQPDQCLLCRQMGHLARDCPNRGTRDDSGINLKRAFGSFVVMPGDKRCIFAGSHEDSTTGSRARLRLHHVSCARCNLAVSFDLFGTVPFSLVSSACAVKGKTRLFCWDSDGTRANSTSLSNAATCTTDSADHRERDEVDQDFSLINGMQHLEPFGEGHIIPTVHSMSVTFGGSLCRVGSFCGGRRQRLCVAGHWSIQISWMLHDGAVCD